MRCVRIITILMTILFLMAWSGFADWEPSDGAKMHFPQLPDEEGWGVHSTNPLGLADDWTCSETGFVKDIHFWGAWRNGNVGQINGFYLAIYSDIPENESPTGYSMPGDLIWAAEITDWAEVEITPGTENLTINEIYYDSPGTDVECFTELYGPPGMPLDGWL